MLLVVKSKEINCRWCHKYAQLQYAQPKTWGFPSLLSKRSDLQSREDIHHFLVLTLQCKDNPRTLQRQPHGKIFSLLEQHSATPSTAKATCQTDKEAFQKLPFLPCPELGHEHQCFWKQKDARFFHYCNINKLLLEQNKLNMPNFLQIWVWLFVSRSLPESWQR